MGKPVLYVFAISHYCEKARWALEYLDVDYEIAYLAPGPHVAHARKLGLRSTGLPILVAGGTVIQGSAEIITWAEASTATDNRLTPVSRADECQTLEKRLDATLGVHVRRLYYSEALVDHPEIVRPVFTGNLRVPQKIMTIVGWPVIRKRMIELMDLGPDQRLESRGIVDAELDWLDGLLSDGRPFLAGEHFSRADIAAASLLAPLVLPDQHPVYAGLEVPPLCAADLQQWKDRPSLAWTRKIYAQYR